MKFTDGYWVNKPGVSIANAAQVRGVTKTADGILLYTVPYQKDERGMGGPVIEIEITSMLPDVLRVRAFHYSGVKKNAPCFALQNRHCPLQMEETENRVVIQSKDTTLVIGKNPFTMAFYYKDRPLTRLGDRFGQSMLGNVLVGAAPGQPVPQGSYMRAQLELDVGEKVYGLGERFTPFVKNGQSVDIWNEDGGTCSEISYKNIPFYVTNRGYGVLVNTSARVSFEVCTEVVTRVQFSVPGEELDFMVLGAADMKAAVSLYTLLSGRPALPPAWSFGLWLSSSFTTSYDEQSVGKMIDGMQQRDIPLRVFHFDCYWMRENRWCDFTWDPQTFPDPSGMLRRLKAKGLKICVWINPYIAQRSSLFAQAQRKGYLLKRADGSVWQWDMWQAGMGLVDFTNPDAWKWFQNQLRPLVQMGIDCFKTDFGERIPTDCVYFDGSDPVLMHNYYTYLYNRCVFELLEQMKGSGNACLFARSATVGGQQFPVHWGGDCSSNYSSMAESLRAGLSLSLCGFGFWSHDISGFEGTAPADVYKRWTAFGLLSTHSRLHGSNSYRVPWLFDEEAVAVLRHFSKQKCRLMPYLFGAAVQAHKTGVPAMRAMVMEFPGDIGCEEVDRQYMLGESLLVAPVFRKDGTVDYYLPKGNWTRLTDGTAVCQDGWRRETHDFFSLPLLIRENTLLPIGARDDVPDYNYAENLTLYACSITQSAEAVIYTPLSGEALRAAAQRTAQGLQFTFSTVPNGLQLLLCNVHGSAGVQGAQVQDTPRGLLLTDLQCSVSVMD